MALYKSENQFTNSLSQLIKDVLRIVLLLPTAFVISSFIYHLVNENAIL